MKHTIRMKLTTLKALMGVAGLVGIGFWLAWQFFLQGRLDWTDWTTAAVALIIGTPILMMLGRYVGKRYAIK